MGTAQMRMVTSFLLVIAGLVLILSWSYRRWLKLRERERFLLAMKEASRPMNMNSDERSRLEFLRSPWWAFWRWLPDLWHSPLPS